MPVIRALLRRLAALRTAFGPQWTTLLRVRVAGDRLGLKGKADRRRTEQQPSSLLRGFSDHVRRLRRRVGRTVQDDLIVLEEHDGGTWRRSLQQPAPQRREHGRG